MTPVQQTNARYTRWFMLVTFLVIVLVDVVLAFLRNAPTISRVTAEAAMGQPLIAIVVSFGMGVLAGHFFWVQKVRVEPKA